VRLSSKTRFKWIGVGVIY